ncbi:hypothetical protein PAXINDRAFT_18376 [Paxillus involutus ATCC 200175]|uniref:Uncharacterized protein n=1 Tax=Paxillus involutus ATCC 200175 TaxID=664439 RepID=A0A0C9SNW6_PAXIN|nr:hypothetical protein PAXINDRAFT_18376 [Paxillus involutus ATCC 200175]
MTIPRTPDDDLALSSAMNTSGVSPPPSHSPQTPPSSPIHSLININININIRNIVYNLIRLPPIITRLRFNTHSLPLRQPRNPTSPLPLGSTKEHPPPVQSLPIQIPAQTQTHSRPAPPHPQNHRRHP